jgi:hypothetical protein
MGAAADPGSTPGASKSVRILRPNVVGGDPAPYQFEVRNLLRGTHG